MPELNRTGVLMLLEQLFACQEGPRSIADRFDQPGGALCYNAGAVSEIPEPTDVRPSPIAGTWYPGDRKILADAIDRYLENAGSNTPIEGQILGLIVPHAGHRYSGAVAARAFQLIYGMQPETVAVLSPLHALARGEILTSGHDAYATPLGVIPINRELQARFEEKLEQDFQIKVEQVRFDQEHALEIELPFLQRVLPGSFQLLAVMLREQSERIARAVSTVLAQLLEPASALVIGSSDLSHFYPEQHALELDREMIRRIESFQPADIIRAEAEGVGYACGRGAIAAALWTARALGADRVKVLQHATSAAVTGDRSSVVGYASAAIYRSKDAGHHDL
jgi:AmmeMemoRadiSam system protein B